MGPAGVGGHPGPARVPAAAGAAAGGRGRQATGREGREGPHPEGDRGGEKRQKEAAPPKPKGKRAQRTRKRKLSETETPLLQREEGGQETEEGAPDPLEAKAIKLAKKYLKDKEKRKLFEDVASSEAGSESPSSLESAEEGEEEEEEVEEIQPGRDVSTKAPQAKPTQVIGDEAREERGVGADRPDPAALEACNRREAAETGRPKAAATPVVPVPENVDEEDQPSPVPKLPPKPAVPTWRKMGLSRPPDPARGEALKGPASRSLLPDAPSSLLPPKPTKSTKPKADPKPDPKVRESPFTLLPPTIPDPLPDPQPARAASPARPSSSNPQPPAKQSPAKPPAVPASPVPPPKPPAASAKEPTATPKPPATDAAAQQQLKDRLDRHRQAK